MRAAAVKVFPSGREVCSKTTAGVREYRSRVEAMWWRQDGLCALCLKPLRIDQATYDHAEGRGAGGFKRDDRIEVDGKWQNAAVCWPCNSEKGSRRVPYLITPQIETHRHLEEMLPQE